MGWFGARSSNGAVELRADELAYVSLQDAAQIAEPARAASWALWLMTAALAAGVGWSTLARVDMITRGDARVIPEGREQVIASLEGGILRELLVREGDAVKAGQPLALLDPTRVESVQAEGQVKRLALRAAIARAQAETSGQPLRFGPELKAAKSPVAAETASYQARQRGLQEALVMNQRNLALLEKELAVAESMSAKGLMSEVEVMRVRRQVNDLNLQTQERVNRFRQEASAELARLQTELTQLEENLVVRDDAVRRTTLVSPVNGLVKQIRNHTVGGIVGPGAALLEIVPVGEKVLVEMRVKPGEIGFLKVGQTAEVKLAAYDFTVYGSLTGKVVSISPDALGDPERAAAPDATWYRAFVEADRSTLQAGGKPLAAIPGMTGTAEVNVGERTVLSYLLRPMMKAREAFQER
ncbi:HlyD family type I secretion periplasmic adaptor subunit [Aquabacterium humicola]|uniref:HlyD family type I secretion periplasmic adaptor subunit n=1 Tax=Aquabacterium humicola TaxID=3237377 RepID=UPI0025435D08|nr:HlyD family type I secretion periplasmic adaptor subunit [Rubrivivax pictus]